MNANQAKYPQLRFKGFTDPWEQRKLGEVADKVTEKNKTGEYTEVLTNSAEYGIISQSDFFDKEIANVKNIGGYYVVEPDDFVYNPRISNSAPVGPVKRNKLKRIGIMSPLYFVLRPHDIDQGYLEYYFSTKKWHRFMELNGDTGARSDRFAIKDAVFVTMPIPFPNIKEQTKIGTFFATLDHLIAVNQRKLAKLKELKQGYLQKMFPRNGSKFPQLRLAGFADAWEEHKLGEITEYIKGFAFKSKDYKKSGYRIIRVSDLGQESIKNSNDSIFTSEEIAIQQKKYKIKQDEIIITTVGSKAEMKESAVGRPIIISESLGYLLNQNLVKIYGKENYSNYFIYSQLLQPRYSDYISMIQRGNANQANIAINDLWEFQILIPEIEEQQKIGSFFKQLDDTIALHQRKLEKLQELKKGYLQKMFC